VFPLLEGRTCKAGHPRSQCFDAARREIQRPPEAGQLTPEIHQELSRGQRLDLLRRDVPRIAERSACLRGLVAIDEQDLPLRPRERPGNGAPDYTSANDGHFVRRARASHGFPQLAALRG
jgi:hypothetical protein